MSKIIVGLLAIIVLGVFFWQMAERMPQTPNSAGENTYNSSEFGLSFSYVQGYEVKKQGTNTLVLLPKGYEPPQNGEGSPSITIDMYDNPQQLQLDPWIRTDSRSNFSLSADQKLEESIVDGELAFEYRHSGLYETDAVAVAHKGKIYVFSAGWLTPQDKIRGDFQDLVSSVEFTQ